MKIDKERNSVKKILLPFAIYILFILTFMDVAKAGIQVAVGCNPQAIQVNQPTTITVTCNVSATGWILVEAPSGVSSASISFPSGGGSVSKDYPSTDFSGSSTEDVGQYDVTVYIDGQPHGKAMFWVSFEVHAIPDFPLLGTAGAAVAMLSGLGFHIVKRRRFTQTATIT